MRPHLHLLGILQLVWGAIGLLLGASMLLLAVGAIAIGCDVGRRSDGRGRHRRSHSSSSRVALLAGGGVNAWAGAALRREESRGRTAILGLGALNLFVLPFGTALSIYAYWVLLHNETRGVFVGVKG